MIDSSVNLSGSELSYYFNHFNNPSALLDAINFGENVSCGYDPNFKEYGVMSFNYNGGRYTWAVNNGRIGWACSESLLADDINKKDTNYKWEMRKASNILSALAQGKDLYGYNREEVMSVCKSVGLTPGFFSINAGNGTHHYILQESGNVINVDKQI